MKKFLESNLGIWTISIIPTIITYITTFKAEAMGIDLKPHLPFIFTMIILIVCISFLYIRKWIIKEIEAVHIKCKALDMKIENTGNTIYSLSKFDFEKITQQFQMFYNEVYKLSNGKIKVERVQITQPELTLLKALKEFEEEKINEIEKMINKPFIDKNNTNESDRDSKQVSN